MQFLQHNTNKKRILFIEKLFKTTIKALIFNRLLQTNTQCIFFAYEYQQG